LRHGGKLSSEIETLCQRELALPNVQVRGFVQDMDTQYASSDVFIMPSLEEGGPKVTAEAAGFGLPMIVSRAGGNWFGAEERGVLNVEPHDTAGFAAAIRRLATDSAVRARLGAEARAFSANFDWDAIAQGRMAALLEDFPDLRR
jgi:glycosyltransferase involved in cell wall biosynthesis